MLSFEWPEEVREADLPLPIKKVVLDCLQALYDAYEDDYDPDDCGYVVLVTRETTDQDALGLFGRPWEDACLEGVTFDKSARCFVTCVLCDNQFGYTILVPDAPWLDPAFRAKLVNELIETP